MGGVNSVLLSNSKKLIIKAANSETEGKDHLESKSSMLFSCCVTNRIVAPRGDREKLNY